MAFMDAVKDLAALAGLEVPAPSPQALQRDEKISTASDTLASAATWFAQQLQADDKVKASLAERGIGPDAIARFGLGLAPRTKVVAGCGASVEALAAAGLLVQDDSGAWRDFFRNRVMIPVQDARGRIVGFAGRVQGDGLPKYINSPESDHFAKGDLLFNLHRAAPASRARRRLLVVEGQFDVVALDSAGIEEAVAPMGTALTERQLERAWRLVNCPILLFDGDEAGRKAALRAAERAMPHVGPGKSLAIALVPQGEDPDSLVRAGGPQAIEDLVAAAQPLAGWLWAVLHAQADCASPEGRSALWKRLAALAGVIQDQDTKAQYVADWRARFDAAFPPAPPGLNDDEMLPDGRQASVFDLGERERTRLRANGAAWLRRSEGWAGETPEKAGRWAWEVGRRVSAGLIDDDVAEAALVDVSERLATKLGAGPSNVVRLGVSVAIVTEKTPEIEAAIADFRRSFDIGKRRGFDLSRQLLDMKCAGFPRTDMGNAERWHARFGQDYLYTTAKGWLGWDGRRYRVLNQEKDSTPAEVMASVFATVRSIPDEAHFVRNTGWPEDSVLTDQQLRELAKSDEDDPRQPMGMDALVYGGRKPELLSSKLSAWALTSEASGRLGCIASLAKRWVTVELTDFDTDPMLLNCLNGTLRFYPPRDGEPARVELRPHHREDRLTKLTACDFNPDAPAPLFQATVKWAQPERPMRRYLRQWLGYNLTGDMGEQIFQIWYGPLAANGKSTVGNACREAIGDYGDTINVESFLDEGQKRRGDQATPDLVRLPGVRFLTAGEPPAGAKINEALINSVTGGDPMNVRDNFRSFFRFEPAFKFTLWCNDLPSIPKGTAGIWRRVKIIPWEKHKAEDERDRDLPRKLRAEYAGILAWMVRGLLDWADNGFVEPPKVRDASADYKHDSDPLSNFLRLCTIPDAEARIQSSTLFETYQAWCKAAGEHEWKQNGFGRALKAKGLASKASNGMHWLGMRLVKTKHDFVDLQGNVVDLATSVEDESSAPPAPPADDYDVDDLPV
jgi:DNA primase